jgi:hypothetical protein
LEFVDEDMLDVGYAMGMMVEEGTCSKEEVVKVLVIRSLYVN